MEHDPNLPPPDTVTITSATYRTSKKELKAYATRSLQHAPTLTVTEIGTMTWSNRYNRHELVIRLNSNLETVTVNSSAGGTATRTVTVTK